MNFRLIIRLLGFVADFLGLSMLFSLPWAFAPFGGNWEQERTGFVALLSSAIFSVVIGELLRFLGRAVKNDRLLRYESIAVVPLSWILAILLSAMPLLLSGTEIRPGVPMSVADAIFEATSGITTTGATVLANIEDPASVPRTILFWRATTHFLGGLGFMVLFVILFGRGVAGKTMLNAELGQFSTGSPMQVQRVARQVSFLYVGMAAVLTILLIICGLSVFDAICHAFSTLSTGGFSTYNGSIGHFITDPHCKGIVIEWIIIVFMILAGSRFPLLLDLLLGKPKELLRDTEWHSYLQIIVVATLVVFVSGIICSDFEIYGTENVPIVETENGLLPWPTALRITLFQVVSVMTGTGFCLDEYERWNGLALLIFIHLMFIGGCSGSTTGGTKVIRNMIAFRSISREIGRAHRPNLVQATVQVGKSSYEIGALSAIMTYLCTFLVSVLLVAFIAMIFEPMHNSPLTNNTADNTANGALNNGDIANNVANNITGDNITGDNVTGDVANNITNDIDSYDEGGRVINAITASLSMFANVGPAFGPFGAKENYGFLCTKVKLLFSWAMFMGRLDLYLPILLFSPAFWKRR